MQRNQNGCNSLSVSRTLSIGFFSKKRRVYWIGGQLSEVLKAWNHGALFPGTPPGQPDFHELFSFLFVHSAMPRIQDL